MIKYSIAVIAFFATNTAFSQVKDTLNSDPNLSKVVHVVTEYEPSISDANRINNLPEIEDTLNVKPMFKYAIVSKPIHPAFELTPINAAKMKGEPLTRLYRGIFTGGLGNYLSTLANLQLSSIRSKKTFVSSEFNHQGSFADVKVNGTKQPSTYTTNLLKLTGKRFIEHGEIYGGLNGKFDMYHAYGLPNTINTILSANDIEKQYTSITIETGIRSLNIDSGKFNYDIKPHFNLFNTKAENEMEAGIDDYFEKLLGKNTIAGNLNINYHGSDVASTTEFVFNPYATLNSNKLKGKIGFLTQDFVGGFAKFNLYPDVYAEYNVSDYVFVPFVVCNGYSQWNGLNRLVDENPYIINGIKADPTNYKINVCGGVKGLMSAFVPYSISGTFSQVDNMHLFVTSNTAIQNTFDILKDNASIFNFHGELGFKKFEKLNLNFKFNYFNYKMSVETKAWQKPSLITTFNMLYNLGNKIIVNLDLFYVGVRDAKNLATNTTGTADGFVDANLGIEYRYTKRISGFVNLNNLSNQNYKYWSYTPVQRFNALFGFSYSFWGE